MTSDGAAESLTKLKLTQSKKPLDQALAITDVKITHNINQAF